MTRSLSFHRRATACRRAAIAAVIWGWLPWCIAPAAAEGIARAAGASPRLRAVVVVPDVPLAAGVRLGGLSDLHPARKSGSTTRLWAVTDRGPNGSIAARGRTNRTIVAPGFVPTLVLMDLGSDVFDGSGDRDSGTATLVRTIPLAAPAGNPLSGRPLPDLADDAILDRDGKTAVASDVNGVDTEGVVEMEDGTFWIAEEYGPSLLHATAAGRVLARFFPAGAAPRGGDASVHDTLPAAYARRRENRGFEALAASPDGTRLFALLQSPLDNPTAKAAKKTGNVRLLAFDPAAGKPVAEYVYRLGDPAESGFLSKGCPPEDGKLCAIATLDHDRLLVLEQADGGLTRLYESSLAGATDTLGWEARGAEQAGDRSESLEQVRDLAAAGIVPVQKRLVADLGGLLPEIESAVYGGPSPSGKLRQLKLEGLAILDERHVLIVNDNDFGVHVREGRPVPKSCLFVIVIPEPLDSSSPGEPP
jgi:hypothetical protein